MQACPYDALYINPNTNTAEKCNYCAHRVETWTTRLRGFIVSSLQNRLR
jgi:Fe-S-cluster-containing dehydrogenase component